MHILISQNKDISEQGVNSSLITKLYNLIYQDNLSPGSILDVTSAFYGQIDVPYTYQEYINTIYNKYPYTTYLQINANGLYIFFRDHNVENILLNALNPGTDGILPTLQVNANDCFNVNNTQIFRGNTNITSFNELSQLVNCKKLGPNAFKDCTNLVSIDLSEITSIGNTCFSGCTSLESITSLSKCTIIDYSCFYGCSSLETIDISNITSIGNYIFGNCTSLTTVINTNNLSLTSIAGWSFQNCTALTTIDLSNVTSIESYAFDGCINLSNIYTDLSNITSIGAYAFNNCESLNIEVDLSNLGSFINNGGHCAFRNTHITKIKSLGSVITSIPGNFANECKFLTSFNFPSQITSIGERICQNDTALTSIDLSNCNITSIGAYAFDGCTNLTTFNFDFSNLTSLGRNLLSGCNNLVIDELDLSSLVNFPTNTFSSFFSAFNGVTINLLKSVGHITFTSSLFNGAQIKDISPGVFDNISELNDGAFSGNQNSGVYAVFSFNLAKIGSFGQNFSKINIILVNDGDHIPEITSTSPWHNWDGYMYVPDNYYDDYKVASYYSILFTANRLYKISDLPANIITKYNLSSYLSS